MRLLSTEYGNVIPDRIRNSGLTDDYLNEITPINGIFQMFKLGKNAEKLISLIEKTISNKNGVLIRSYEQCYPVSDAKNANNQSNVEKVNELAKICNKIASDILSETDLNSSEKMAKLIEKIEPLQKEIRRLIVGE